MFTNPIIAAIVAAASAVTGALLAAHATRSVEAMRVRASLEEKAEERRLAAMERFLLAVNGWVDWLIYMEEQGWEGQLDELNRRVKARDDSYRQLLLLAPEPLYQWLTKVYGPLEYLFKSGYVHEVRWGMKPSSDSIGVRRQFTELLRDELMRHFRPELAALRDPVGTGR